MRRRYVTASFAALLWLLAALLSAGVAGDFSSHHHAAEGKPHVAFACDAVAHGAWEGDSQHSAHHTGADGCCMLSCPSAGALIAGGGDGISLTHPAVEALPPLSLHDPYAAPQFRPPILL
jgi:hypothetical protein